MKNGVVYITLSDDKMHFLYRRDRNVDPLMLSTTVQSDDDIPRMVVQFASDNDIEPDRAVVAMDGRRCMLRNYAMPIQRRRQLDQAVQFEMDDDIPFERDESLVTISGAVYPRAFPMSPPLLCGRISLPTFLPF